MQTDLVIPYEQVRELLPKSVELVYVDYRDSLDDHEDIIQEAVHKQDISVLGEQVWEWYIENEDYGMDYVLKELKSDLMSKFDIDEDETDNILDEYQDRLRDDIHDRDESDTLHDLFRNTRDFVCFYDTGYEVPSDSWAWSEEDLKDEVEAVKTHLKIETDKYDNDIDLMIRQASYGGRLVIYFTMDEHYFMSQVDVQGDKPNTITFEDPMVAVIDTYNGSGDHTDLPKHKFSMAFDPENVYLDKTIKYSYTYRVCGMYPDWCECTGVKLSRVENPEEVNKSSLAAEISVEQLYIQAYKAGGCTFSDMDINRHRGVFYKNEFPCGQHCPHCGTFWID